MSNLKFLFNDLFTRNSWGHKQKTLVYGHRVIWCFNKSFWNHGQGHLSLLYFLHVKLFSSDHTKSVCINKLSNECRYTVLYRRNH